MNTQSLGYAIRQLDAAFRDLMAIPIEQLSAEELRTLLRGFGEVADKHHDLRLRLIGQIHQNSAPAALGGTSAAAALSKRMGIPMNEASALVAEAIAKGYG